MQTTETTTNPWTRSATRIAILLARAHGHGWARHVCLREDGGLDVEATIAAQDEGESQSSGIAGLRPSLSHVTTTGRLRWVIAGNTVTIEVTRPGLVLRSVESLEPDPSVFEPVIRAHATVDERMLAAIEILDSARVESRHLQALIRAIDALDSTAVLRLVSVDGWDYPPEDMQPHDRDEVLTQSWLDHVRRCVTRWEIAESAIAEIPEDMHCVRIPHVDNSAIPIPSVGCTISDGFARPLMRALGLLLAAYPGHAHAMAWVRITSAALADDWATLERELELIQVVAPDRSTLGVYVCDRSQLAERWIACLRIACAAAIEDGPVG